MIVIKPNLKNSIRGSCEREYPYALFIAFQTIAQETEMVKQLIKIRTP